ncbi:hypothetical protein LCGC14_0560140 [marine sediment metagenome]|uniref:Uncharacterized protein n=1 Tax=marine sediment metagenome TaxID=412755 RepID=A0A0F9S5X9_9ZZZZ
MTGERVKVCFKCELYIIIYSNDSMNMKFENIFSMVHSGHMVQIVNLSEIEKEGYVQVCNSEDEMKKLVKEVEDSLSYIDGIGYSW